MPYQEIQVHQVAVGFELVGIAYQLDNLLDRQQLKFRHFTIGILRNKMVSERL